jgi:head-tail adaptor
MAVPAHLLRDLTLQTRTTTTDAYGATVADTWADSTITGRVDQRGRSEDNDGGRTADVSEWLLITNATTVTARSRVVDGGRTFEVVGDPWPVHRATVVHHYEATLRLVTG